MRNAIVLGSGRSGTSLLAGLFQEAGYFSGDHLWGPTPSNPAGYFEDREINKINEDLIDKVAPWRARGLVGALTPVLRDRPRYSQRWLAALPAGTPIPSDPSLDRRMAVQARRRPYLFKDPRFSYTLTNWMPNLAGDTVFLCIFREPQRTVSSIMKIVRDERYLRDLRMSRERACAYWEAVYRSVLAQQKAVGGDWLFIHYDELLSRQSIPVLESYLGARADLAMLRPELKRSAAGTAVGASASRLFAQLAELAEKKYARL